MTSLRDLDLRSTTRRDTQHACMALRRIVYMALQRIV